MKIFEFFLNQIKVINKQYLFLLSLKNLILKTIIKVIILKPIIVTRKNWFYFLKFYLSFGLIKYYSKLSFIPEKLILACVIKKFVSLNN